MALIASRTGVTKKTAMRRIRRYEQESGVCILIQSRVHRQRLVVCEDTLQKIAS